ncbi:MAG TPA: glycoside hydrolase family 20 zincin-like fold domain-containing protein [Verrucomicrobiae bacterium]|nr:glycoside hydrolase family 20 zincin-like fold domain-containing protein [Verrucomicrobiae bacterium]
MKLLPHPRFLERQSGSFLLPARATLQLDASLSADVASPVAKRLQSAAKDVGVRLRLRISHRNVAAQANIRTSRSAALQTHAQAYVLNIGRDWIRIEFHEPGGLWAAVATLRQLIREYGRRLPCLKIRDWPDFPRRGVMLDISRGRVPRMKTLLELVEQLADFKINEFQLYTEHTFAYRKYTPVWRDWGALTGTEIEKLDAHCRRLGIELVPNQNSFGHLRWWLEYPPLKKLAEVSAPWPDEGGAFLRYPSTLAPEHPGTLPFLRGLYNELLPHFRSDRFNVGCDETWDLGRGQSRKLCEKIGKGRVYLRFLKKIHRELAARKKRMMFWGDIILRHPELVPELPRDVIALNWGYEAGHPFGREAKTFAAAKIPFYVCPGTSTWATMIGRHDNAFANLREAAKAGRQHGAEGFLITDWGDGGHPQPLAVSMLPYLYGAALSWCAATADEKLLTPVTNRDVFQDPTGKTARAALALGLAHCKLGFFVPNLTPLGAVIAAPPPEQRELFCRDGLKYFASIPAKKIHAAMREVEVQRTVLRRGRPVSMSGKMLAAELDMAARMAVQSCQFMLWQQTAAAGRAQTAARMAKTAVRELREIEREFAHYWPTRNKGTPAKCAMFLRWRIEDYRRGRRKAG